MKLLAAFCVLAITIPVAAFSQMERAKNSDILVSTDWLAKHLNDDNLVVIHVNWSRGSYKRSHIPGARFLWIPAFAKDTPDRNTELPSVEEATTVLKDLGINKDSRIVIYFVGQNVTLTTRMLLTLTYLGVDHVAMLDGGFDAWKNEGRPVTNEIPNVKPGTLVPVLHPEVVTDADWLLKHLSDPGVTIIDARARRYYDGSEGGGVGGEFKGHIPHSVSIPYSSLADSTNHLLDPTALRKAFETAGVKPGSQVVTYCHVGQQATFVYFVARYLGYDAKLYDGSFEDWSDRGLPVENPSEKK